MKRFVLSAAAGLAGGALGLFVMRHAMQGTQKVMDRLPIGEDEEGAHEDDARDEGSHDDEYMSLTGFHAREEESATGALARGLYGRATGRELDERRHELASEWVHRGYGEAVAVGYALLASGRGWGVKGGVAFGFLLWLFGDEIMVPLLGLAKKPSTYSLDMHVTPLVAHLAYGAAVGAVVDAAAALSDESHNERGAAPA